MSVTWATGFTAFGVLHAVTLASCAVGIAGLVWLARRERRRGRGRRMDAIIAAAGLTFWSLAQGYYVGVERDWSDSLPLHLCDLAGLLGPLALFTRWRVLRTTLYFWALGLTVWGLLTPTLAHGPDHLRFWLFWVAHSAVVFYAVHDCVVNGYRPFASDWGTACLVSMGYVAVVLPLNLANAGWNYAYVGDAAVGAATPLDMLPAWPWRILWVQGLGAVALAAVWLPWEIVRWRERRKAVGD